MFVVDIGLARAATQIRRVMYRTVRGDGVGEAGRVTRRIGRGLPSGCVLLSVSGIESVSVEPTEEYEENFGRVNSVDGRHDEPSDPVTSGEKASASLGIFPFAAMGLLLLISVAVS